MKMLVAYWHHMLLALFEKLVSKENRVVSEVKSLIPVLEHP